MSEFYDSGSERRFVRVGNAAAKNGTVVAAKGAEADRKINGGEAVRSSWSQKSFLALRSPEEEGGLFTIESYPNRPFFIRIINLEKTSK
jgi:hypothetical protein